jgi:hypothetical protein
MTFFEKKINNKSSSCKQGGTEGRMARASPRLHSPFIAVIPQGGSLQRLKKILRTIPLIRSEILGALHPCLQAGKLQVEPLLF